MKEAKARAWFALTAFVVFFGVIVQVFVAANFAPAFFHTTGGRVFNVFCFFTIQSNLIVGVTSLWLAVNPNRSSTVFSVFRLTGVIAITITGVVYHSVLRGLLELDTWGLGYTRVLVNAVWIAVLYLGLAAGAATLDRKLAGRVQVDG